MTKIDELTDGETAPVPESLKTLIGYLERALDKAASVVMLRHTADVCTIYLGDPSSPAEELRRIGSTSRAHADEMLEQTSSGVNVMQLDGQAYRFVRSFTQVGESAAIVFKPD